MGDREEGGHEHRGGTFWDVVNGVHDAQHVREAIVEGGVGGERFGQFVHAMDHHAYEENFLTNEEYAMGSELPTLASGAIAPLAIMAGTSEFVSAEFERRKASREGNSRKEGEAMVD